MGDSGGREAGADIDNVGAQEGFSLAVEGGSAADDGPGRETSVREEEHSRATMPANDATRKNRARSSLLSTRLDPLDVLRLKKAMRTVNDADGDDNDREPLEPPSSDPDTYSEDITLDTHAELNGPRSYRVLLYVSCDGEKNRRLERSPWRLSRRKAWIALSKRLACRVSRLLGDSFDDSSSDGDDDGKDEEAETQPKAEARGERKGTKKAPSKSKGSGGHSGRGRQTRSQTAKGKTNNKDGRMTDEAEERRPRETTSSNEECLDQHAAQQAEKHDAGEKRKGKPEETLLESPTKKMRGSTPSLGSSLSYSYLFDDRVEVLDRTPRAPRPTAAIVDGVVHTFERVSTDADGGYVESEAAWWSESARRNSKQMVMNPRGVQFYMKRSFVHPTVTCY